MSAESFVTAQAQASDALYNEHGHRVVSREQKIEYRDEQGNLLDPEQVAALEGQISFETKYETRTRVVDADGNEIGYVGEDGNPIEPVHPPHPDVEGRNPETKEEQDVEIKSERPPTVEADHDLGKERSVQAEKDKIRQAKPGSERDEATIRNRARSADEL